jgi:hypothetical protein
VAPPISHKSEITHRSRLPTNNVISTEATDSLTVRRAVERPPYWSFAFAVAVASLFVIPEGDLLVPLQLPLQLLLPLPLQLQLLVHPDRGEGFFAVAL